MKAKGINAKYEPFKLPYNIPSSDHTYTPDFVLLPSQIIIETKGIFDTADRKKMRLIKQQHPKLDIRLVFSNASARIAKKSKTTYAQWAETNGYKWAHRHVPEEWVKEALQGGAG